MRQLREVRKNEKFQEDTGADAVCSCLAASRPPNELVRLARLISECMRATLGAASDLLGLAQRAFVVGPTAMRAQKPSASQVGLRPGWSAPPAGREGLRHLRHIIPESILHAGRGPRDVGGNIVGLGNAGGLMFTAGVRFIEPATNKKTGARI